MSRITFAWYGVKSVQDAGCHYDRESGSTTNFDNGFKWVEDYHLSDGSGNALNLEWGNITHMRFDDNEWLEFDQVKLDEVLSTGDWWRTKDFYKQGLSYVNGFEPEDAHHLGWVKV